MSIPTRYAPWSSYDDYQESMSKMQKDAPEVAKFINECRCNCDKHPIAAIGGLLGGIGGFAGGTYAGGPVIGVFIGIPVGALVGIGIGLVIEEIVEKVKETIDGPPKQNISSSKIRQGSSSSETAPTRSKRPEKKHESTTSESSGPKSSPHNKTSSYIVKIESLESSES